MVYITSSGVSIPQSTDAFSPGAQFKTWADGAAIYENRVIVDDDTARNAIATPTLREGLSCYVKATDLIWTYDGSSWSQLPRAPYVQETGTSTFASTLANGGFASVTVTFTKTFTSIPNIQLSANSARVTTQVDTRSTTGFRCSLGNFSGATATAGVGDSTLLGFWRAVQMDP